MAKRRENQYEDDVSLFDDNDDVPTEQSDIEFWVSKQRELVTSQVDYNLTTIKDLVDTGAVNLTPGYQRRFRWNNVKKSKFIESLLMNVPVPQVYFNEDDYGSYSVIDGKQRFSSIHEYLSNSFPLEGLQVFSDINGLKFLELPTRLQTILRTRPTVRATIILRQSDRDIKYEVFQRLNTGGVHLNPQEIRNNAFTGILNETINRLGESKEFHNALGIRNKHSSAIYQQMRDSELVLRFFTFRDSWGTFKGGIRRSMDSFMEKNRNMHINEINDYRQLFLDTLGKVTYVFGDHSFHRWMPEKNTWRHQVLASLYDAQMFSFQKFPRSHIEGKSEIIMEKFIKLFEDDDFRKSIDAATNTPQYIRVRISKMIELLDSI